MATSILTPGEMAVFSSFVKKHYMGDKDYGLSGTIIAAGNEIHAGEPAVGRVVFVTESGIMNEKYGIHHWYCLLAVKSVRGIRKSWKTTIRLTMRQG